jgi:phage baseplate assembly protein gpV
MSLMGTTTAQVDIEVEGAPLDPLVKQMLVSAEVHTTLFVPSQFKLVFRGPRTKVLEMGGFQLAVEVMLQVSTQGVPIPLMLGEVTAVEIDYGPEGDLTIVRGLDRSHRLMRGTQTMTYPEMTASDVVTAIVGQHGLPPGEIVPTENLYEWLSQANISAWAFIKQLCALENYVAYVDAEGLFCFGPLTPAAEGEPPSMTYEVPPVGSQLVLGRNLVRLRAVVSAAEQVPATAVWGFDPTMGTPVVGPGEAIPAAGSSQSLDPAATPVVIAGEFEAEPFMDTSRPFDSMEAATTRAEAIANDIAGALAELEGQCIGNPSVLAGQTVSLGQAGPPFDGMYTVTSARHVFDSGLGGYTTWFTVGGRQDRSLYALTSSGDPRSSRPEIPGVVIGMVLDNADPEELGRIKIQLPWLNADYISAWAPVVQLSASESFGSLWLPEIGDQVLVGFDRGNIDYPYVLGCLYSGVKRPEPPPETEGVVGERRIMSRARHMIEFNDGPELINIRIVTGDQTVSITLDAEEQALNIVSAGQVSVEAVAGVSVKSGADVTIEAGGQLSIQAAGGISMETAGAFSVETADAAQIMAANNAILAAGESATISAATVMLGA